MTSFRRPWITCYSAEAVRRLFYLELLPKLPLAAPTVLQRWKGGGFVFRILMEIDSRGPDVSRVERNIAWFFSVRLFRAEVLFPVLSRYKPHPAEITPLGHPSNEFPSLSFFSHQPTLPRFTSCFSMPSNLSPASSSSLLRRSRLQKPEMNVNVRLAACQQEARLPWWCDGVVRSVQKRWLELGLKLGFCGSSLCSTVYCKNIWSSAGASTFIIFV